ncbi:putative phage tail protein [Levilactobacillus wangkuiensis]|uniref:putative phage tail protein n=1 Tax=Levilactobacillus wangkuiensis TaxID=2799566 RepID=UPI00194145A4|nr:putative phage tail protein [Levilactobacillus wangkuiensis]
MLNLKDYLPSYYDGVREMQRLMEVEQKMGDRFGDSEERLLMNQFVMQADSEGLALFEYQLGIPTDYTKSLESRQYDVLMRILPPRPITIRYFQELIQSLDISAVVDVDHIRSHVDTMSEAHDITPEQIKRLRYLLNVYLPVNMTYQIRTQTAVETQLDFYLGAIQNVAVATVVMPDLDAATDTTQELYAGAIKPDVAVATMVREGGENLNE